MQGVAVRVRNGKDVHTMVYECHTPEKLADVLTAQYRALIDGWEIEAIEVA